MATSEVLLLEKKVKLRLSYDVADKEQSQEEEEKLSFVAGMLAASVWEKFLNAIGDEPREVFRDFMLGVQNDVGRGGCRVNSHWRPQYCFCSIARFLPSYHVIPFANMSTEAVKLVDRMQRPSPERADLLREFLLNRFSSNYDSKAQGATTKRDTYFSRESLDIIKQVYAKDYDLFGAHFEEQYTTLL